MQFGLPFDQILIQDIQGQGELIVLAARLGLIVQLPLREKLPSASHFSLWNQILPGLQCPTYCKTLLGWAPECSGSLSTVLYVDRTGCDR